LGIRGAKRKPSKWHSANTWSETPPPSDQFAPRLGQHTGEVLTEAGYSQAEIDDMIDKQIAFPERRG